MSMNELLQTVITLSFSGVVITLILLCLKPLLTRWLPARWQYYIWFCSLFFTVLPIYKLIPAKSVGNIRIPMRLEIVGQPTGTAHTAGDEVAAHGGESIAEYILCIWLLGLAIFLAVVAASYAFYLISRKKKSVDVCDNEIFERVKNELGIRRKVKLRVCSDVRAPSLSGVLFPVVYIPEKEISPESQKMIFLHELTHYKRGDLLLKWTSLFINAVHWFNPLIYIAVSNISDFCEISCDIQVTKNMSDYDRKVYMNTILDFAK